MFALARVRVFIAGFAVKLVETAFILREVGGYPVQDDADIVLVTGIDEVHEVLGRAVARCSCKVAADLITPGAVKRIFRKRHEFYVGVTHLLDVWYEFFRKFSV